MRGCGFSSRVVASISLRAFKPTGQWVVGSQSPSVAILCFERKAACLSALTMVYDDLENGCCTENDRCTPKPSSPHFLRVIYAFRQCDMRNCSECFINLTYRFGLSKRVNCLLQKMSKGTK
jgi:hypothetical protein